MKCESMTFLFQEWVLENICGHYRDDFNHKTVYEHVSNSPGSLCSVICDVVWFSFSFVWKNSSTCRWRKHFFIIKTPKLSDTEFIIVILMVVKSNKLVQDTEWTHQQSIGISDAMAAIMTMSYQHAFQE